MGERLDASAPVCMRLGGRWISKTVDQRQGRGGGDGQDAKSFDGKDIGERKERHIEKDCGWGEWKSESCQIGLVGIGKNDRALMSSDAK